MAENNRAGGGNSQWKYGLRWNENLETGHEKIDEQHKELFRLMSDLIEACESGSDQETVGRALNFLTSYTMNHFADEETLMTQNNYPGFGEHKKAHENFKQTVTELIGRYQKSGSTSELSREVNSIIARWLTTHITLVDRTFADFVRSAEITP